MIKNTLQKIACKRKWLKHAVETNSLAVLEDKSIKIWIFY
jgi:hypothetical protein